MNLHTRLTKLETAIKMANQEPTKSYIVDLGANLPIKEGNALLVPAQVIEQ